MADTLQGNLGSLRKADPDLAARIEAATPLPLTWSQTPGGHWSATVQHDGRSLQLASRYDPLDEARRINREVDLAKHGAIVILGLGVGYHVAELAREITESTLLIVYEPDRALLRAVLEKMDFSAWLGRPNVLLADDAMDRPAILKRVETYAGMMTQGTILVHHPPTRQRQADKVNAFCSLVTEVLGYCRLHIATMLVNSGRTIENLTGNLKWYVGGATTNELAGAAQGYPAVCVSAGPSLARNVQLLANPGVRRNVVVITAQTTLKPLLERGIRPDFVTALDYHEISRRFYEGLPPLPEVTLVAEPKAHPSVLDGFPGPVRITASFFLDRLLGPQARPILPVKQGSTVAHLSLYLAQHLGCDPILLIGQDLGFSDGLYYCPGTAIHEVWAPELSPFNTLEMMEWQRIVRHRGHLEKRTDVHGRPIYSDEQMTTYLKQFERDFALSQQQILDCTEGGLPKAHAQALPLAQALARHATRPVPALPRPAAALDPGRLSQAAVLLQQRIDELRELKQLTLDTIPLMMRMLECQRDQNRMDKLFERVQKNTRRVQELNDAFALVNDLNALGTFKRARADRAIAHADTSDPFAKQRLHLERDLENLNWLKQALDEGLGIFGQALRRLEQAVPQ